MYLKFKYILYKTSAVKKKILFTNLLMRITLTRRLQIKKVLIFSVLSY